MSNNKSSDLFPKMSVDELLNSISDELGTTNDTKKDWSIDEIDALLGLDNEDKESTSSKPKTTKYSDSNYSSTIKEENNKTKYIKPKEEVKEVKQEAKEKVKEEPKNISDLDSFFKDEQEDNNFVIEKATTNDANEELRKKYNVDNRIPAFSKEKKEDIESKRDDLNKETTKPEETFETKTKPKDFANSKVNKPKEEVKHSNKINSSEVQVSKKTLADVVPTYNKNIKHNIMTKNIEKNESSIENDKYRNRFINAPKQHIEKTAEYERNHVDDPPAMVERPGFIVKKKDFRGTADLEPIPTIISADDELDYVNDNEKDTQKNVKVPKEKSSEEIEGQIKLSGFNEEEKFEQIDEDEAEQELRDKRVDKVKSFKIETDFDEFSTQLLGQQIDSDDKFEDFEDEEYDDEYDEEYDNDSLDNDSDNSDTNSCFEEYESVEQKDDLIKKISKKRKIAFSFSIVETFVFVASLVFNIIYNKFGLTPFKGLTDLSFILINMLFLLLASAFAIETTTKGFLGLVKFKANASTGSFVVFLLCLIQCIVLVCTFNDGIPEDTMIYAPIACFSMMFNSFGKSITLKRVQKNFEFCTGGTKLYSTEKIAKEEDAFEIGRGLLLGEPDIRYSSRIKFPSNFMKNSFDYNPSDSLSKILVPVILCVSAIIAVVSGVLSKDPFNAYNAFVGVSCIGIPVFSLFISNLPLFLINKKLNERGCALLGHNPAYECNGTNAIVVDSSDLFMKGYCNIDGIKTYHNMRIDEAILDAAALVIKAGGPLVNVFDGVILNRREILPPVESIAYEERLGLSAWIQSRRVLLGSRDLLKNHNVEAPSAESEVKYLKRGKKVLYLSVAGKIAAMFVVSYYANDNIAKVLQGLEDSGVTTLIKTCDCNINEELICKYFDLDENSIKIISPVSGQIFDSYVNETIENSSSGIYHNGTDDSFINSIIQSLRLNKIVSINSIVQIVYSVIAVIVFGFLTFTSGLSSIGPEKIIIFEAAFAVIASLIPIIKRN